MKRITQKELKKLKKEHNIKNWGETPDGVKWCTCSGHTLKSKCPTFKEMYYRAFIEAFSNPHPLKDN